MSRYCYTTSEASKKTGYAQSTIRLKAAQLVKIIPFFAVKDDSDDWLLDEKAIALLIIIKSKVKVGNYESVEQFAIASVYHINPDVKFPLAIPQNSR